MRRWLRPAELPDHGDWDLWRLRDIGAWGDAGRIVGLRWEELGGAAANDHFGDRLIPLWPDKVLGRWLGTVGLPNADALLLEPNADGPITLRSVDLKWTLDTADYAQIAGETLRRLVERAGERLTSRLPSSSDQYRFGDGLFVSPERELNRLFLRSKVNQAREYPIEPREVTWVAVDPVAFFTPLPGWALALQLARLERADATATVEVAERYYFLGVGVGVRGALLASERTVFAEREGTADGDLLLLDPAVEARAQAGLEALIRTHASRSARDVARALQPMQTSRQDLRQRLRALERFWYRQTDFMSDAAKAGRRPAEDDATALAAVRAIYRDVSRLHAGWVRARGRQLVASGQPESNALDHLREEMDGFKRRARAEARKLLKAAPPPEPPRADRPGDSSPAGGRPGSTSSGPGGIHRDETRT